MRARGQQLPGELTPDVAGLLARLRRTLEPRVGKRMTEVVVKNLARVKESGGDVVVAIHATLDAYARIPQSGTPFPLDVAKAIADAGCLKLWALNTHRGVAPIASNTTSNTTSTTLVMRDHEALAIAHHADALLPAYGDDDAEFAVRVAYKNTHHYRHHLVVGEAFNRNDHAPTQRLWDAWQAQGARGIPLAVVPGTTAHDGGVIYALGTSTPNVTERFVAKGFVYEPHRGDPVPLDDVGGLQRFFALHPLPITPQSLAWVVHLVRFAFPTASVDVDGALTVDWEPLEEEPASSAASLLLGLRAPPPESRARVIIRVAGAAGDVVISYAPGELSAPEAAWSA